VFPSHDQKHGEVVFFEIVGYTDTGQRIMPDHSTKKLDKDFQKQWGDTCSYLYGCSYGDVVKDSEYKERDIYVYRIAITNEEGVSQDLSWPEVKQRCSELGVNHVPELEVGFFNKEGFAFITSSIDCSYYDLDVVIESQYSGPSTIDEGTHKEGVCLRITPPVGSDYTLKHKNWNFRVMEGIIKDSDSYVDEEESN